MKSAPSTTIADPSFADALATSPLLVVGLCAAWCDTCGEFAATFDALAARRDDATFVWLDIEDDADVAGDIDVENFPTLALYRDGRLVHFGTSLPQGAVVARLLDSLGVESNRAAPDPAVAALPGRLAGLDARRADRVWRRR